VPDTRQRLQPVLCRQAEPDTPVDYCRQPRVNHGTGKPSPPPLWSDTDAAAINVTRQGEVLKLFKSSRLKPSPVDVLPSSPLRSSAVVLAPVIAHLANLSLAECRFPAAFDTAQVWPQLKKLGLDKEQMSNYRPISNLPTVSKVIEWLVLDRLRPHLLSSPNFSRLQSAYRRGHSIQTALLHVMNSVYTAVDNKKATALVGLDISAAFNTIAHDVLPQRLQTDFGAGGATIACCTRTSPMAAAREAQSGFVRHDAVAVRRATGLGTWAAALHVVRVTSRRSHPVTWYVVPFVRRRHDDTQLFIAINTSDTTPALERLAVCASAVRLWFLHNGLQLNADKSEVVILGTGHELRATANITVAGSNLIVSDRLKSLGVTIDSHLRSTATPITKRGHATTTLAPYVTYAVCYPMTWRRHCLVVSWHPDLTTTTPCCTEHQQRPSLSCNGLRTTSPASFVSAVAAKMQSRY